MATYNFPLRLPKGDSKPMDPNKHSLVKLPAEIRNQIFGYLVEFSDPVRVTFVEKSSWPSCYFFKSAHEMPTNLFLACRTTYSNAASAFYANNTFLIALESKLYRLTGPPLPNISIQFLKKLGSQAHWIRKVTIDLERLYLRDYHGVEVQTQRKYCGFDVWPLLRFLWDHDLAVDIAYINSESTPGLVFDASAIAPITRCILEGQLMMLMASHNLTGAVLSDYDGSGGVIVLNKVAHGWKPRRFELDPDQHHSFVAEDGGRRLTVVQPTPGTWLSLPKSVLHEIVSKVIQHPEELQIDLDVDTELPLGLPHVNKELYATHWRDLQENTEYTLLLHSTDRRSRFSNFGKLARLLRHQFTLPRDLDFPTLREQLVPKETWMLEYSAKLKILLGFNLTEPTALEDLRTVSMS